MSYPLEGGYFAPFAADLHNNRSNVLFFDGHLESFKHGTIDWNIADYNNP
jgi:prepilin-type processing-associated H-X9-DG protein